MPVYGNGEITPMNDSVYQRLPYASRYMTSTNWHSEGTIIAVQVGEAPRHPLENVKVLGVGKPALGGAMSGDDFDSALQWQRQDAGIGVLRSDNWQRVLAACMSE